MTKVINMFAGPGAGKSTIASGVFHQMKLRGDSVELVTEYAKELTWDGRMNELENQMVVTGTQAYRIARLVDKVDYIITDSPILISSFYCPKNRPMLRAAIREEFDMYDNMNFIVKRQKEFVAAGRNQTEEESKAIDVGMKRMLVDYAYDFTEIQGAEAGVQAVLDAVDGKTVTEQLCFDLESWINQSSETGGMVFANKERYPFLTSGSEFVINSDTPLPNVLKEIMTGKYDNYSMSFEFPDDSQ